MNPTIENRIKAIEEEIALIKKENKRLENRCNSLKQNLRLLREEVRKE